ncbi:MAG: hypothetical protein HFF07_02225 [Oscillospiraceae bacterium]|nr:hypothetical protein [Oscillospiraceae bacterium]
MGFISLVIIFCWPLLFILAAFAALLIWLNTALNMVVTIMLVANIAFLILLLFLRTKWKAAGRMELEFINSYEGWRHYGLLAAKVLLTGGMVWEAIVVAVCALLLLFRPWSALLI